MSLVLFLALCWIPVAPAPEFKVVQLDMVEVCGEFLDKYSYRVCSENPNEHANLLDFPEPKFGLWALCRGNDRDLAANFIGA